MKIQVKNFKGAASVRIEAAPIACLLGPNGKGKTSVCQAVALALTGQAIPPVGIPKSLAGAFVHGGAEKGQVVVAGAEGATRIKWPKLEIETKGTPPTASNIAAGICDKNNVWALFSMDEKTRSKHMAEILDVLPKKKDLFEALAAVGVSETSCLKIWSAIETNDWDPTHKKAKEHGAKLKGQWEEVSGERYGGTKGGDWIPDDWEEDLTDASAQSLSAALAEAKTLLEEVVGNIAVDDAESARLKEQADDLDAAKKDYSTLESKYLAAVTELEEAEGELDALPPPHDEKSKTQLTCPYCNRHSFLEKTDAGVPILVETESDISPEERAEQKEAYEASQSTVNAKRSIVDRHRADMTEAERRVDAADAATTKLDAIAGQEEGPGESVVDERRHGVAVAEQRIAKFDAWTRATTIHKSIQSNQKVVKILEPGGLRKKKLKAALSGFHKTLAALSDLAGWSPVTLDDDDLELCYGPRRFALMSESEKYKTRVILQTAVAKIDGSQAIVLDGADILDIPGRKDLFKLLLKSGITAVIAMTLSETGEIPGWVEKICSGGKANAYWIDGDVCEDAMWNTGG